MDRLKLALNSQCFAILKNLHSNMDRLKPLDYNQGQGLLPYLHSNMDRLKQVRLIAYTQGV